MNNFLYISVFIAMFSANLLASEVDQTSLENEINNYAEDFAQMKLCNPNAFQSLLLRELKFPMTCVGQSIDRFELALIGDAAKKLNRESFIAFMKMRAKNDFGFLTQGEADYSSILENVKEYYSEIIIKKVFEENGVYKPFSKDSLSRLGMSCGVWTVGEDYPVAVHVECSLSSILHFGEVGDGFTGNPMNVSSLGYTSETNLERYAEEAIEGLIKDLATDWTIREEQNKKILNSMHKLGETIRELGAGNPM